MSLVRGACPTLFEPMPSGDGLLLRVKPSGSRLTAEAAHGLAAASARHGNGAIELTNRGNLQFRGFDERSARAFAEAAVACGAAVPDPAAERRRSILVSPLAGVDPACAAGTLELARALEAALVAEASLRDLPVKFGMLVDGGGSLTLHGVAADVALRRRDGRWSCTSGSGTVLGDANAMGDAALQAARSVVSGRAARRSGGWGQGGAPQVAVGPLAAGAWGIGVPPGRLDAAVLRALADLAAKGDGLLRLTPWRAILLAGLGAEAPRLLRAALPEAILRPDDVRLRIASCTGRPGCVQAEADPRGDADRLAKLPARDLPAGIIHLSGCAKGCAHPKPADWVLRGRAGRYDLIRDGRAGDVPLAAGLAIDDALPMIRSLPLPRAVP